MDENDQTRKNYGDWQHVYNRLNAGLFNNSLPGCVLTFQRQRNTYGFHAGSRFEASGSRIKTDEIALNPRHFAEREPRDVLATLAHEMTHQHQWHFGTPSPYGYHNKEWARLMIDIGLVPTSTGKTGEKATGRRIHHFIREGGPFDRVCTELLNTGFIIPYVETNFAEEVGSENGDEPDVHGPAELQKQRLEELLKAEEPRRKKAASKSRYTCPGCEIPKHVWGKPGLNIIGGDCERQFEADAFELAIFPMEEDPPHCG